MATVLPYFSTTFLSNAGIIADVRSNFLILSPRMNNKEFSPTICLQNVALFIFSLFFILAIGGWLFPKFLNKIPFRLYGGVETDLRVLAQYSKRSVLPENYIAILGDSNSVGVGDLYIDLSKSYRNWYPDYSPAHFIYKKLGIDTVSFGFAGAGNFDGIWSGPVNQFKNINSKGFDLKPPKTILVFFYEGNDLSNNLQFVRENYKGDEGIGELVHSIKFNEWLNHQFQKTTDKNDNGFEKYLIFTKFLIKSVKNIFLEKSKKSEEFHHTFFPATPITQAIVNGIVVPLPVHLQAPPLIKFTLFEDRFKLLEKEGDFIEYMKAGFFIFEKATLKLKENFPNSALIIIYLPSVLSSYKIVSPIASFRANMGKGGIVDTKKLVERHFEVCREILHISQNLKVPFFDTTPYMLDASSKGYIHGPIDWDHLNEYGYRVLSDSISQFILHLDKPYKNCTKF